jgi:hypothetical protein
MTDRQKPFIHSPSTDLKKGDRIWIWRRSYYGEVRGFEVDWFSYNIVRVTKNKIQVKGMAMFFPKFRDGKAIKYLVDQTNN